MRRSAGGGTTAVILQAMDRYWMFAEFHRDLDPDARQPLFAQLVRAITDDISGGRSSALHLAAQW